MIHDFLLYRFQDYLEHLLFKGTDDFGTSDFEEEKVLLDSIVALYEKYRGETDSLSRKKIYEEIGYF